VLYHFLVPLADYHIFFNLFRYITFRAAGAMATALVMSFLLGPWIIARLRTLRVGQVVRDEGPAAHLSKAGTPTMGGVLIIVAATVATLLWANPTAGNVIICLIVLLWTGALGFLDDYLKVVRKRTEGLVARYKLIGQGMIGLIVAVAMLTLPIMDDPTSTMVPFFADWHVDVPLVGLHPMGDAGPGRQLQRGQPERWPGRAGGRARRHRHVHVRRVRLRARPRRHRPVPGPHLHPRRRRAVDLLRGPGRRVPRLPVVQRAPGRGVHGGHRDRWRWAAPSARWPSC
jgi:hypothetical protein